MAKRYKRRFRSRRRRVARRFNIRKVMRIRASRPEIKYWNNSGNMTVSSNSYGTWELIPEQLTQGVSNNQRIGAAIKTRNLKLEVTSMQESGTGGASVQLISFPVRYMVVKRRITDDTDWAAYLNNEMTAKNFLQGNFAGVMYDVTKIINNSYRNTAVQNYIHIKKVFKIPMNIAYSQGGDMSDYKDMIYFVVANDAPPTSNMNIVTNLKVRVSYIDN